MAPPGPPGHGATAVGIFCAPCNKMSLRMRQIAKGFISTIEKNISIPLVLYLAEKHATDLRSDINMNDFRTVFLAFVFATT